MAPCTRKNDEPARDREREKYQETMMNNAYDKHQDRVALELL